LLVDIFDIEQYCSTVVNCTAVVNCIAYHQWRVCIVYDFQIQSQFDRFPGIDIDGVGNAGSNPGTRGILRVIGIFIAIVLFEQAVGFSRIQFMIEGDGVVTILVGVGGGYFFKLGAAHEVLTFSPAFHQADFVSAYVYSPDLIRHASLYDGSDPNVFFRTRKQIQHQCQAQK
jgi:hypothetical protein